MNISRIRLIRHINFLRTKRRKFLAFLLVLSVLFSSLTFLRFLTPKEISAAWFDDTYAYRLKITFTHNADISSVRSVTYSLDTAEIIAAGLMQSDCDDTRFTDGNGKQLLFDLTGTCNNAATTYEIIFPSIVNGTNVAYVYYSNPSAPNGEIDSTAYTALTPSGGDPSDTNPTATDEQGPAPISYWNFDDGNSATANDYYSQQNNDLTITNATVKTEDLCVKGFCLGFDGNADRATKSYSSDTEFLPGTGSFTVSTWFKHTSTAGADTLISRADAVAGVGWKLYMDSSGFMCFGIDGTAGSFPSDSACSSTSYADSQWHYLVGVKSTTSSITTYIDGNQIAQDASITASSLDGTNAPFTVGNDFDNGTNGWDGFIDEVKYYNFAKTAAQIKTDFTSRGAAKGTSAQFGPDTSKNLSTGLVGYWKMDQTSWTNNCSAGSALDSSGNSLNGKSCPNGSGISTLSSGKFGNSPLLDGSDDYIDVNSSKILANNNASSGTICAWTYPLSTGAEKGIYSENGTNGVLFSLARKSTDVIMFQIYSGVGWAELDDPNTFPTSSWTHACASYNSALHKMSIYHNGVLAISSTSTWDGTFISGGVNDIVSVLIGNYTNAGTYEFSGNIDELRIYNRELSPKEIEAVYNFAPGPVGYWKLDDNTGTTTVDSSGNGITSSAFTGNTTWAAAKYGSGLTFDGTDDVARVVEASAIDLGATTDSYTVEAWTNTSASSLTQAVVAKDPGGTARPFLLYINTANFACFSPYDGVVNPTTCGTTTINDGVWHHLTGVRDVLTDTIYIYVDGILVNSTNDTTTLALTNNADVSIGNGGTSYAAYDFNGKIDDVRVYNYSRTAKQIIEDLNAGHPSPGSPVSSYVARWKMDDLSGTTAQDSSDNNNDLTLSAASWTTSGKFTGAWNGTGSDPHLSRADDADFDFGSSEDFSLSAWVKSDSASNPAGSEFIIDKQVATNNPGYSLRFNTSGQLVCEIDDDTTSWPEDAATGTTDYYDNSWHHVVCIRDITLDKLNLYVDGKLHAQDTDLSATGDLSNADSLTVGAQDTTAGGTDDFAGDIDEVKIFRSALTPSEVLLDMNLGSSSALGAVEDHNEEGFSISDPVGLWKLDEQSGTNATDVSGNGNDLTLTNSPTYRTGKYGSGINFAGSDAQLTRADDADFDFGAGSSFTLETWFKHDTASALQMVLVKYNEAGYKLIMESDGDITCGIDYDSTWTPTDSVTSTAATYDDNSWHHTACVKSANTSLTLYIDGQSVGTPDTSLTNSTLANSDPLYIGIDADGTSNDWVGDLDQIKIYNSALTQAQVAYDYNRGAPVAWYKMDECSGATAHDAIGTNNGTITIGASGTQTSIGDCTTSGTAWYNGATGKYSASLNFDGTDDYVQIADANSLDISGELTVSAWVKLSTVGAFQLFVVKDKDTATVDRGYALYIRDTNFPTFFVPQDTSASVYIDAIANHTLTTGTWYHIVGTFSPSTFANIYINGKLDASYTSSIPNQSAVNTQPIGIAKRINGNAQAFSGQVDDVRVYNYALTATQIQRLYNEGAAQRFGPQTGSP